MLGQSKNNEKKKPVLAGLRGKGLKCYYGGKINVYSFAFEHTVAHVLYECTHFSNWLGAVKISALNLNF